MSDHAFMYSPESLSWLVGGFAVGGIMANTSIDNEIHRRFQSSVRSASTDDWFEGLHAQRELGNGRYTLPLFAAAWATGALFENGPANTVSEWGERSLRTVAVGAPPMLLMQRVTGASRPGESSSNSRWKPFQDDNGVSGHSFMGAIPFLTAAQMTDEPWLKFVWYAGSTLAPLSRINDDAHYPSQALLGWWMAFIASRAVTHSQDADWHGWQFAPFPDGQTQGVAIERRF